MQRSHLRTAGHKQRLEILENAPMQYAPQNELGMVFLSCLEPPPCGLANDLHVAWSGGWNWIRATT